MGWLRRFFAQRDVLAPLEKPKPSRVSLRSHPVPPARTASAVVPSRTGLPLRLFQPSYLSRTTPGVPPNRLTYAALDVETTGHHPHYQRICEAAVVRFGGDGTVLDEYVSLIDPQRPMGATDVHNITSDDVDGAPTFAEAWPDILRMLSGTVVVAHNLPFEDKFLAAELKRTGRPAPTLAGLCSLVACRAQLDGPSYKLQSLYRTATGQWIEDAHTALGDCRALAMLIPWLIANAPTPLHYLGLIPPHQDVPPRPPGRIFPRAARMYRGDDGYLGGLAKRFPLTSADHPVDPAGEKNYAAALDEITEDQRISSDEGWRMERLARRAGFNQQRLTEAHRQAWVRATADDPITDPDKLPAARRRRLIQLAQDLGHPDLAQSLNVDTGDEPATSTLLKGWRIGLDGDSEGLGKLSALVTGNGGAIAKRLTTTVRFVATLDPDAHTPLLFKARELELPILTLETAQAEIMDALTAAAAEAEKRKQEHDQWQAEWAKQRAEDDAYFRHKWRPTEAPPEWVNNDRSVVVNLRRA